MQNSLEPLSVKEAQSISIVLPGRLDRKEFPYVQDLCARLRRQKIYPIILDMYGPQGAKLVSSKEGVYNLDTTAGDYLRYIRNTVKRVRIRYPTLPVHATGFSYGGQIGLLIAALDGALNETTFDTAAWIMPTNFYRWDGSSYDTGRDMKWLIQEYLKYGTVDMSKRIPETRQFDLSKPEGITINVARRFFTSNAVPYDRALGRHIPFPAYVPGLVQSGILNKVRQRTLVISGQYNTLVPDADRRVRELFDELSPETGSEFISTPTQHDYREDETQVELLHNLVADWMVSV